MRCATHLLIVTLAVGCTGNEAPEATETTTPTGTTTEVAKPSATSDRDSWQKPQEVFMLMGNDLRGRTIADLAAGDGYFTFKLIEVGANVIAISDDQGLLDAIEARKQEMKLGPDRLRTRLVPKGQAGLAPEEVDACLLVHSYVSIPDKKAYLQQVYAGTKMPKPLFIVEWLNTETPMGPPMTDRISSDRIMDDVGLAGYTDVGAYATKIPNQVFLFASFQNGLGDDTQGMDPAQLMNQ